MKKSILLAALVFLNFSGVAFAQTHTSATPLAANTTVAEDTIDLPHSKLELGNSPFWIRKWSLKDIKDNEHNPVTLKTITNFDSDLLMTFSGADFTYLNQKAATSFKTVTPTSYIWTLSDENLDYKRTYDVQGDTVFVNVAIQFKKNAPEHAFLNVVSQGVKDDKEARDREIFYYTDSKVQRNAVNKSIDSVEVITPVKWVGAGSHYFVFAIIPDGTPAEKLLIGSTGPLNAQASLQFPVVNKSLNLKFKIVFVPKYLDLLRTIDPTLDSTVSLGFFTVIAYPILWFLKFIYKYVGNYGIAIIILTICIKILTFPLVLKGMKGARKMAEFQPKMKALQEKYKDDKTALNREMMAMMKTSGYNPMAGCFPMLLQMPIFFALYRVLYVAVELYQAPFALWIHDLSARDPFYITPVLMAVLMFLQQKMTPPAPGMDPNQRKVMQFMPLMFGLFMVSTASGLCLYMLVNSVISIIQQQYLNKKLGVPGNVSGMATSF